MEQKTSSLSNGKEAFMELDEPDKEEEEERPFSKSILESESLKDT